MTKNRLESDFTGLQAIMEGIKNIEDEQLELLDRFQDVRIIQHVLLQHEISRLKDIHGQDHPIILDIEERLSQNLDIIHRLEVESEFLKIKIPKTEVQDVLIHGRVTDENDRGLKGLVVTIMDRKENEIRHVEADASGYFAFVIDSKEAKKIAEEKKEGIYLAVINRKGEVCYRKPEPFKLEEGIVIREDIAVSPGDLTFSTVKPKTKLTITRPDKSKRMTKNKEK